MKKRIIILMLCLILAIPMAAYAENESLTSLEAPKSFNVRESDHPSTLLLRFANPDSIAKALEDDYWILYEFDWKVNNGAWKFNNNWGPATTEGIWDYYGDEVNVKGYINNIIWDEDNALTIFVVDTHVGIEPFDLQNNTYHFRIRYVYEYDYQIPTTGEWGYKFVVSPYVESSIGKQGTSQLPTNLEAPRNLTGELKKQSNGQPYFHFKWEVPDSVSAANQLTDVISWMDWKIGSGKWASESGELMFSNNLLGYSMDADPIDKGGFGEVNIEENIYHFRGLFEFEKPDGTKVRSPFSNVVTIGTPVYSDASSWAEAELKKAADAGLIPDILKGADMTKPITREEFAELAVLLYEKTTGKAAQPVAPNPFNDTVNPQILKAFNLGITTGISTTSFAPNVLINREQCATMLFRTIKAIDPDGDYTIDGVRDFPDQKHISGYAVYGTKYMFRLGIIKGDNNGNFMPRAITTAQEAAGYGAATREAAILMSIRTYEVQN